MDMGADGDCGGVTSGDGEADALTQPLGLSAFPGFFPDSPSQNFDEVVKGWAENACCFDGEGNKVMVTGEGAVASTFAVLCRPCRCSGANCTVQQVC